MLSLLGLSILRGPTGAALDAASLLSTEELRDLVARLIDELDSRDPDPEAEPDPDPEPDADTEPGPDEIALFRSENRQTAGSRPE